MYSRESIGAKLKRLDAPALLREIASRGRFWRDHVFESPHCSSRRHEGQRERDSERV
jgi:hypothetical protein